MILIIIKILSELKKIIKKRMKKILSINALQPQKKISTNAFDLQNKAIQ